MSSLFDPSTMIDVADFGAVGDGVRDDSQEIQNAIDYATLNLKSVFFDSGVYRIGTPELLSSGTVLLANPGTVKLEGTGGNTSIIQELIGPQYGIYRIQNVTISGLIFDGDIEETASTNNANPLVTFWCGNNISFIDDVFQNTPRIGILLSNVSSTGIADSQFSNIGNTLADPAGTMNTLAQGVAFCDSNIVSSINNYVTNSTFSKIGLDAISATEQSEFLVARNKLYGLDISDPTFWKSAGVGSSGIYLNNNSDVQVLRNSIFDASGDGIDVVNTSKLSISNNVISESGAAGISVSGIHNSLIYQNRIYDNNRLENYYFPQAGITFSDGIWQDVSLTSADVIISQNDFSSASQLNTQNWSVQISMNASPSNIVLVQNNTKTNDENFFYQPKSADIFQGWVTPDGQTAGSGQIVGGIVTSDPGPIISAPSATSTGTLEVGQTIVIGSVAPGILGDKLTIIGSSPGGALSLGASGVDGVQNVMYTATRSGSNMASTISYTVYDQYADAADSTSVLVQIDKGPSPTVPITHIVGHGRTDSIGIGSTGCTAGIEGDTLKFTAGTATYGTLATSASGSELSYAAADVSVPTAASFDYAISDQYNDVLQANTIYETIDPGPAALDIAGSVSFGATQAIGFVTPGLPGDILSLSTTEALGTLSLASDGTLIYSSASPYDILPYGNANDTFTYTISDQWGDTVTRTATITINCTKTYINGPIDGYSTISGSMVGENIINITGFKNTVVLGQLTSDIINGGFGETKLIKKSGDMIAYLSGYNNDITAERGNHKIAGSSGELTVNFLDGNNSISFFGFNNSIKVGNGDNFIFQPDAGGSSAVTTGNGTQTIVLAGSNNTVLCGNSDEIGTTFINAGLGGFENVTTGDGNNYIVVGGYGDTITVGTGVDVIVANGSSTSTASSFGNESPTPSSVGGGAGNATIKLGNILSTSSDYCVSLSGWGNTVFLGASTGGHFTKVDGGLGDDVYVLPENGGNSMIKDFQMNGGDCIDISNFLTRVEFADIFKNSSFEISTAGDVLVTINGSGGTAKIDIFGNGIAPTYDLLSHFTFGH